MSKKKEDKKRIDGNMTFYEAIKIKPKIAKILAEKGLFCGGCPMAMLETIEKGAKVHGVDLKKLLEELNK